MKNGRGDGHEYRVAHLAAIENIDYDHTTHEVTENESVIIENLRKYWKGSLVLYNEKDALEKASKMLREFPYVEYGIQFIEKDLVV